MDFSHLRKERKPTKKQETLYRKWVGYLRDSKLSEDEIHKRASNLAEQMKEPRD